MAQKFIITNTGHFRFGNVRLHRDLLLPGEECLGGGFYEFSYASASMLLWGKSYDFGRPAFSLLDKLIVPSALSTLSITYEEIPLQDFIPLKFE
ncbi:MAG: hypothetical protein NC102_02585 [Clostridium sp.]|nr:hypothetical protein [Clostridium sp.]